MKQEGLDRINALARKSRESGLTPEEQEEQKQLRAQYLADFRKSLFDQLDHTTIVDEQGNKRPLRRREEEDQS